jgi:hypothetical protein
MTLANPTRIEVNCTTAQAKLAALGLSAEEIAAL